MKKGKYYLFEMDMTILNVVSIALFFVMIVITALFHKVGIIHNWNYSLGIILILMIPYLIIHEVLHSIAYVLHGADFKKVTYGAHIEKGVLCCLCKQNVSRRCILTSLLYPFVIIGVITYIIGICFDLPILTALSVVNISGCAGDLVMFFGFLPLQNFEYSEYDDPTAFGLYSTEDLSKKKLFGLKYVDTKSKLDIQDLKKISISKSSIICFIVIILVGLLYTFLGIG